MSQHRYALWFQCTVSVLNRGLAVLQSDRLRMVWKHFPPALHGNVAATSNLLPQMVQHLLKVLPNIVCLRTKTSPLFCLPLRSSGGVLLQWSSSVTIPQLEGDIQLKCLRTHSQPSNHVIPDFLLQFQAHSKTFGMSTRSVHTQSNMWLSRSWSSFWCYPPTQTQMDEHTTTWNIG